MSRISSRVRPGGTTTFHPECVADARKVEEGRVFDTIAAQIAGNGDTAKRLVVKMDVEGAEWQSLLSAPDSVLEQIDQLAIEFHWIEDGTSVALARRLKQFFEDHLLADLSLYDEFEFALGVPRTVALLRDYHAQLVELGKHHCLRSSPRCRTRGRRGWAGYEFCNAHCNADCHTCPLLDFCAAGGEE